MTSVIQIKKRLDKIPEQIKRLSIPVGAIIVVFVLLRNLLIPSDFGKFGHYRASAVDEIASLEIKYIEHNACVDCHDEIVEMKNASYHRIVTCEACHGPAAAHTEDPGGNQLSAPRERGYCPLCHEYLPSRPTGFPQIITELHNPRKACATCHDAHDPKLPYAPKECEACHAEIARTLALSHHFDLTCTRCHKTPEEHKVRPRDYRPEKPLAREFCGECHGDDASAPKEIPRIDMATHNERYVCWQCHYPHLPEVD